MLDIPFINMEANSNEFKLTKGGSQKILNAENGLTFCIQVLDENSIPPYPSLPSEPTISVVQNEVEEDELISHEIVDEPVAIAVNNLTKRKSEFDAKECDILFLSSQDNTQGSVLSNDKNQWTVNNGHAKDNNLVSDDNNGRIKFNIKKRKTKVGVLAKSKVQNGCKPKKEANILSIVLKNQSKYQKKNYSQMKMMFDPKSGKHVIKSTFVKPSSKETFTVEPWMLDKTSILQDPKEKLFIMSKHSKSSCLNHTKDICLNCKQTVSTKDGNKSINSEGVSCLPEINLRKEGETDKHKPVNNHSKTIHWEEGNIDKVSDYNKLSENLKRKYSRPDNLNRENTNFVLTEFLSDISMYEAPVATKTGGALGVQTYLSWEAVKERIEELEEENMTKFTLDYRSPKFRDDPEPFKRIYFDLDTIRKDLHVVIPNSGIPFVYIGICVYTCHLGKKRCKTKESLEDDLNKPLKSKRIGCPAVLAISRIARFPDYDISGLSKSCEAEVLNELKDAWDLDSARVRYYIEYHVQEPKASDHKGHQLQYLVNSTRLREPVDPRIIEKVRDLTRQGHVGLKIINEMLVKFIREELFKGEPNPPLHRRRYNPTPRDIRYAIHKAREELKKEGKSMVQLQCSAIATEIAQMVKDISNEQYLTQLKSYLMVIRKTIKAEEPLDTLFTFSTNPHPETPATSTSAGPVTVKRTPKRRRAEAPLDPLSTAAEGDFLVGQPAQLSEPVMEQFYINMAPETTESVFGAAQLYAQELVDINTGLTDDLPSAPEDNTVTEVYYYYPDGTCELAIPEAYAHVQS